MSFTCKGFCLLALLFCLIKVAACSTTVKPSPTTVASLPSTARISSRKYAWELDSAAMLAKSTFKIKPAALVERCKAVVDKGIGLQNPDDLAEDFTFQFPIVGPLSKKEYLSAVGGFSLGKMFPGFDRALYSDFRCDPLKPNRVWFMANFAAEHSGEGPFGKPTGTLVVCPPQAISLTFNEQGKCTKYTGGYVMDKEVGNSGGLGGVFGPLYAIGKALPFPEARPWTPSLQYRLFNFVGSLAQKLAPKPKAE